MTAENENGVTYLRCCTTKRPGDRRVCQTALDTNYVYERDEQTISKRDKLSSERDTLL